MLRGDEVPRRYIFADEAGDFEFARKLNVSRYYIIGAISLDSCDCGTTLLDLRRHLIWKNQPVRQYFHASHDKQSVRDEVFNLIRSMNVHVYAQIMEKSKAQPKVRSSQHRFYQYGWYYLLKFIAPRIVKRDTELMLTAASIGTNKGQAAFTSCVNDVLSQTTPIPRGQWVTAFCPAAADPCLQIADYCTWAIQRKWESGGKDTRSYALIADKIKYEYDMWAHGTTHYY